MSLPQISPTRIPHYKLFYFGVRERGEAIRYIFAAADVPYEEEFIEFSKWAEIKPKMKPFHTLPVLEVDHGKASIGQHLAICRFLAKRFGLDGKDAVEQAKADMYVDGTNDLYGTLSPNLAMLRTALFAGKDTVHALGAIRHWCKETFNPWLTLYEGFLQENPTKSGWLVGEHLTWADLYIAEFVSRVEMWNDSALKNHPKLAEFVNRVHSVPGVAKRAQNRADHLAAAWGGNPAPPM